MKRKYISVKMKISIIEKDIVTASQISDGVPDDPNVNDGYNLSGLS